MKALTLWPEWAWAIHTLDKRIENRSWAIPRGEWFGLHAGKHVGGRPGSAALDDGLCGLVDMAERAGWDARLIGVDQNWTAIFEKGGAIHGIRGLRGDFTFGAVPTSCLLGRFRVTGYDRSGAGWAVPGQIGNVLEYQPFRKLVPCKGAQGLWVVPAEVAGEIGEVPNA